MACCDRPSPRLYIWTLFRDFGIPPDQHCGGSRALVSAVNGEKGAVRVHSLRPGR